MDFFRIKAGAPARGLTEGCADDERADGICLVGNGDFVSRDVAATRDDECARSFVADIEAAGRDPGRTIAGHRRRAFRSDIVADEAAGCGHVAAKSYGQSAFADASDVEIAGNVPERPIAGH